MGIMKKFFNNTRKPEGKLGRIMVNGMNGGAHTVLAEWGVSHISVKTDADDLDCGCGGGANVARLLKMMPDGKVTGLDYSEVSVAKSKEVNAKEIQSGRCQIIQGNVAELPFAADSFDVVTAFETIYFWPGLDNCFKEIYKVLKSGGVFMITNESDGQNAGSLKWTTIVEGMTVYTGEQIKSALLNAGFADVKIDDQVDKDRICVCAYK